MNKIKNNESPYSKNKFMKLESKYISLINSLSFSIKELYLTFSKILKELNTKVFEQNNYIFTCKCLINEMNNKNIYQEKFHNLVKNIEGINVTNKYIIKYISDYDEISKNFFNNSKIIFKKMKELKSSNINIVVKKKIKNRNNISGLIFSEENNLQPESFTTKKNIIKNNSNKKTYINLNRNENLMNLYEKKFKNKKYEINTNDIIYLSKKILKGKNNKKMFNHSQDEIITDLTNNNLKKRNFFLNVTPHKNISWSKEKTIPFYRSKNIYSLNNTNSKRYYKINNTSEKKNVFKTFKFDSSSEKKFDNNNLIEFIENIIDYFYLLKISQNMIINEPTKINHEKKLDMKLKQNLTKLNYSIFIINNFFMDKISLKRKLNYIISQKDIFEQKLKNFIHKYKQNDIVSMNNIDKVNNFETNRDYLINSKELEYIKIINKLRTDNNNLAIINQKIISQNKLLINQLSLFENNEIEDISNYDKINAELNNNNNILEKLIKENKKYKEQINYMKKDNEQLCSIIKKLNNNNEARTNSSYFLNNSHISNIINYNTDINNNNNNLNKKKKETENLNELLAENKMLKKKLNEKKGRIDSDKLNEEFEKMKIKSETYLETINEKDSLIKSLNLNINNLKNELNDTKNNYNHLKENLDKNKQNNENQIKQLKSLIEEKNIEIKKLTNDKTDKDKKIKELLNSINKLNNSNKNLEKQKKEIMEKSEQQTQEINQLESIINVLNEKLKILGKNENNDIINIDNNNNENNSKRISTPSFKSPEEDPDEINNLKKENELLLNKVKKYETILKNNDSQKANEENTKNIIKQKNENKVNNTNNQIVNNYFSTISSMKINKLYTSNEFIILSDVSFNQFKWYLMKKKNIDEEISEIDSYENLIWVPVINIIDIEKFEYEELENNSEIINLIKKLEEKENIISKLSYKLSKFEKGSDKNIINIEENIDNEIDIKKSKQKIKTEGNLIPIEKYNELLDKLNNFEYNLDKIKKENSELIKYKKLYLDSNEDHNPINKIDVKKKQKQEYLSNSNDEIDYYKKKCEELQMLLNVFKEGIKNILMKLVIPKKDKGEIKQILKLFEFTKEETSIILGDKKI